MTQESNRKPETKTEHTPRLPIEVVTLESMLGVCTLMICDLTGNTIAQMYGSDEVAEDDANLIVTAVNHHLELVDAVQRLKGGMKILSRLPSMKNHKGLQQDIAFAEKLLSKLQPTGGGDGQ